ncbi:hypothetical protein TSOC_001873 [Tetrabaena socialis]|uniref:Uncharacterized protein n=1 Tax=Tetrabaena socialis TaxID=47790 RepID=A0A2J8AFI2_9CHLO|nr:hypothetical protein TSOC_001873 [Tetrabaena socialis]|eukprot:PNH11281.1 hypothetical protein TSOC_001873 [Tetrabaena socialis]
MAMAHARLQRPGPLGSRGSAPEPSVPVTNCRRRAHPSQSIPRPCGRAAPIAAALSTYPLMEQLGNGIKGGSSSRGPGGAVGSHSWLSACVRHIVASTSSAGLHSRGHMLQLVFSSSGGDGHHFKAVPISKAVAENPENWGQIAAHVSSSGASGLVLVRPIASPDQYCAFSAAPPPPMPSSSFTSHSASSSPAAPAPPCCNSGGGAPACLPSMPLAAGSVPGAAAAGLLEGDVGDCCGGDAAAAPQAAGGGAASPEHPHPHQHQHHKPGGGRGAGGSSAATRYFGLVVQGSSTSDTDGCWVLKTSSSDGGAGGGGGGPSGGCTCTHFTLTRVCLGQPLAAQLRDAWLVPQGWTA